MWWAVVALLLFPVCAMAQTIKVTSGEHDTFSRLVLTLPAAQPWQLGRTANGYELALESKEMRFDVSGVFDLIPKDRLKGIFVDPNSGNLQITVGCACHALPFSLNDTTIVIDLRDGPPPDLSSFELGLGGQLWADLTGISEPAVRPRFRQPGPSLPAFDWMKMRSPALSTIPFPIPQTVDGTDNIRESLVAQLADGAARAVISLALPEAENVSAAAPYLSDDIPIRVMGSVGLQIGNQRVDQDMLQPGGEACFPDEILDIGSWAAEDAAATQYSGLYNGLVGEFDRPQNDAIVAAAKRQIYLGFGAEARSMLTAFGDLAVEDETLLALADLIDSERPALDGVFTGMASCDTAAAMWAFLADDQDTSVSFNDAAVKSAFSALPAHLRLHLGPRLVEALIAADRNDVALSIRDAMGRGPVEDTRAIAIATADVLMANDNAEQAIPQLEMVMSDGGTMQGQALVKLVAAQIVAGQPVQTATADAIFAMIAEHEGHPLQEQLLAAYGLALAGSQQFAAAVDFARNGQPLAPAFWSLLAELGTDDELLMLAIRPSGTAVPPTAAQQIAYRLEELGFPDEAAIWREIPPPIQGTTGSDKVQIVTPLAGVPPEGAPAPDVPPGISGEDASVDQTAVRTARWDRNWSVVAQQDSSTWGQLALALSGDQTGSSTTSLASATASLSRSTVARELIAQLLKETTVRPASP